MRDPRNRPKASRFGAVVRARKKLGAEFGALPVCEIPHAKRDLTLLFLVPEESGAWSLVVEFVHSGSASVPANPVDIGGGITQHAMQRLLQARLGSRDAAIAMTTAVKMTGTFGESLTGRLADDRGLWVWNEGWLITFIPENALDARRAEWREVLTEGGWRGDAGSPPQGS
jgi:hypothetical protein